MDERSEVLWYNASVSTIKRSRGIYTVVLRCRWCCYERVLWCNCRFWCSECLRKDTLICSLVLLSLYICALWTIAIYDYDYCTRECDSHTHTTTTTNIITFAYSPRTSSVSSLSDRTSETPTYSASSSGFSFSRKRNRCLTWRPSGPGLRRLSSRLLPFNIILMSYALLCICC